MSNQNLNKNHNFNTADMEEMRESFIQQQEIINNDNRESKQEIINADYTNKYHGKVSQVIADDIKRKGDFLSAIIPDQVNISPTTMKATITWNDAAKLKKVGSKGNVALKNKDEKTNLN